MKTFIEIPYVCKDKFGNEYYYCISEEVNENKIEDTIKQQKEYIQKLKNPTTVGDVRIKKFKEGEKYYYFYAAYFLARQIDGLNWEYKEYKIFFAWADRVTDYLYVFNFSVEKDGEKKIINFGVRDDEVEYNVAHNTISGAQEIVKKWVEDIIDKEYK